METQTVAVSDDIKSAVVLQRRLALRMQSADDFIEKHASGTLRKNKRLGMVWRDQYLHERTAWEFGWLFECLPRSRVTFGDAFTEGDVKALTEAGWHIERYLELSIFPEDRFETKYITIDEKDGTRREGVGLICRQTSAPFVPGGHIVFAIVAPFDAATNTFPHAEPL